MCLSGVVTGTLGPSCTDMALRPRPEYKSKDALLRMRERHISTFDLIDESEIEAGIAEAERTLSDTVEYDLRWLVALGTAA